VSTTDTFQQQGQSNESPDVKFISVGSVQCVKRQPLLLFSGG